MTVGIDTYITVTEADTYFASRLGSDFWDNANSTDKEKALLQAFRRIERKPYRGYKQAIDQSTQFPRSELFDHAGNLLPENTVPDAVKFAQCEDALYLLQMVPTASSSVKRIELQRQGVTEVQLGKFRERYDGTGSGKSAVLPSLAPEAFNLLDIFLLRTPNELTGLSVMPGEKRNRYDRRIDPYSRRYEIPGDAE